MRILHLLLMEQITTSYEGEVKADNFLRVTMNRILIANRRGTRLINQLKTPNKI